MPNKIENKTSKLLRDLSESARKYYEQAGREGTALNKEFKKLSEMALQLSVLVARFNIEIQDEAGLQQALRAQQAAFDAGDFRYSNTLKGRLRVAHQMAMSDYCTELDWYSPDPYYNDLAAAPRNFSPKEGGAKNAGEKTGVYTFERGTEKETILIKQAEVGELVAEYMGSLMYELLMPDNAAKCTLFRDNTKPPGIENVYVGSVYSKADKIQDAFEAVGFSSRVKFAGTRARFNKAIDNNNDLIHKILKLNEKTDHGLEKAAAVGLFVGDNDFHTGNLIVKTINGKQVIERIDYGFSFFNFGPNIIDVASPTEGRVVKFRLPKKGKMMVEFFPTNHYWDLIQADPDFFKSAHFISACESICALKLHDMRHKIETGLNQVILAYGPNAIEALKAFAKRIGMPSMDNLDLVDMKDTICDHMVQRLMERQEGIRIMKETAEQYMQKPYTEFSHKIQRAVDAGKSKLERMPSGVTEPPVVRGNAIRSHEFPALKRHHIRVHEETMALYETARTYVPSRSMQMKKPQRRKERLHSAVYALMVLKEANEAGILKVSDHKSWTLSVSEFESHCEAETLNPYGTPQSISRDDFETLMERFKDELPRTAKSLGMEKNTIDQWMRHEEKVHKKVGHLRA